MPEPGRTGQQKIKDPTRRAAGLGMRYASRPLDKCILRAIELGEHSPAVIRRVVQLLYYRRRYEQADGVIRRMREQGPGLGDPQLQRLAAEGSMQLNDPTRALEMARSSTPADSLDSRDHLWLGQVLWVVG